MNTLNWIKENTKSLQGKTIAISGATGGIGKKLCRQLAYLEAKLILLDRNTEKSNNLIKNLKEEFPKLEAEHINLNLQDIYSVKSAVESLKSLSFDVIIFNAGAYSIPRETCVTGCDNVFQINFASPYYIIRDLFELLINTDIKVVVVGSIAHNYSKIDISDFDFSERKSASKVYGNAKRFLMFSLFELYKNKNGLAVTHPGITFTNITAHYPELIFAVIKRPMKIIFMKPAKAALSILSGVFCDTEYMEWIGPRFFDVWGIPKKKKLRTCSASESEKIFEIAEKLYLFMKNNFNENL